MLLRCRACGAEYNLERYVREMDETWEEAVGNIPCDRL
ncbi:MAG: dual CXXC motif small (seleno)protein [Desulfohalobiaceae bacterium]